MSAGARIDLDDAVRVARWFESLFGPGLELVGSARRGAADVGDLEFIAPHRPPVADELYRRLDNARGRPHFTPRRGLKPGFRSCSLLITGAASGRTLPVEIHRFDPGETGNRGWIEVLRTGSREFNVALLSFWRARWRIPWGRPVSEHGYLLDQEGRPVPTPDEMAVFRLAGAGYVQPSLRRDGSCLVPTSSSSVA